MRWNRKNFLFSHAGGVPELLFDLCSEKKLENHDQFVSSYILNLTDYPLEEFIKKVQLGEIEVGSSEAPLFKTFREVVKYLEEVGFPRVIDNRGPEYFFYCFLEAELELKEVKASENEIDDPLIRMLAGDNKLSEIVEIFEITPNSKGVMFLKPVHD